MALLCHDSHSASHLFCCLQGCLGLVLLHRQSQSSSHNLLHFLIYLFLYSSCCSLPLQHSYHCTIKQRLCAELIKRTPAQGLPYIFLRIPGALRKYIEELMKNMYKNRCFLIYTGAYKKNMYKNRCFIKIYTGAYKKYVQKQVLHKNIYRSLQKNMYKNIKTRLTTEQLKIRHQKSILLHHVKQNGCKVHHSNRFHQHIKFHLHLIKSLYV